MEDKKVTNSGAIRLRRAVELREFALAAFYPLTHAGDAVHLRRIVDAPPVIAVPPLRGRPPRNPKPEVECSEALEKALGQMKAAYPISRPNPRSARRSFRIAMRHSSRVFYISTV